MQNTERSLPDGPLVAWYGDDFTGASAVMEVLSFAGLPSMLFLQPPTEAQLTPFPGIKGIGVASTARAQSPEWMDTQLSDIFSRLKALNPAILHYKVCSTLDSSPDVGSIGRAIEIGADLFPPAVIPVLIAAPQMRRYQCFGHLFAGMGEAVFRLDRHPVMSRHPITPMDESDVAVHIAKQSNRLDVSCISLTTLGSGSDALMPSKASVDGRITAVTLDSVDARSESATGQIIWQGRHGSRFVVGSQGVEYALVRHWQDAGLLTPMDPPKSIGRAEKMVVVSGSVSPTTAEQIAWSKENGFAGIAFDASVVCDDATVLGYEMDRVIDAALEAIAQGLDPLIHTAEGPDDPAVNRFRAAVAESEHDMSAANQMTGEALGRILYRVLERSGARRAVVSGGDTSGHATRQLGIFALSALAPTIPAAAIFKAHADGAMDGLELALKGGQMGSHDYFGWVRSGGGAR
ncbi:four-carbon acid sugar kinase family protein [Pseudohalocynthiibacter aestuariivivens]|uniref:Four-carbon acid sugar kinase family protein n=1 Tax=Pseudohalocynthiibacter aestuariivivens TaxID=1591409 RepID=A0ABV5JEY4_9RHOB|nr:four-carbon acid sugar kinase family protein [Pseudohalocynthiibacter aestuariivivens]MBS9718088.1 four-carbon acid sugar kinase family protein [Pseudohalocynthiibacter aestuariivivens]